MQNLKIFLTVIKPSLHCSKYISDRKALLMQRESQDNKKKQTQKI